MSDPETRAGSGRVLGAHWDGSGTNFAVFSTAGAYGGAVELCLIGGADGDGDERGRTQRGNNNAYCQANDISWYDWTASDDSARFEAFTAHVIGVSLAHATLRRTSFFDGGGSPPDITWLDASGRPMTGAAWGDPSNHFIACFLAGDAADEPDDDVLLVLNASLEPASLLVPGAPGQAFTLLLDTGLDEGRPPDGTTFEAASTLDVAAQTVLVASAPQP